MATLKLNRKIKGTYFNNCGDIQIVVSKNFETNLWFGYIDQYSHTNENGKVYNTIFCINNLTTKKQICDYIINFINNN
tara:strand:- start:2476 stop:2709 length:234 start_codon:yes stop_codon:yes gene_type:complete